MGKIAIESMSIIKHPLGELEEENKKAQERLG